VVQGLWTRVAGTSAPTLDGRTAGRRGKRTLRRGRREGRREDDGNPEERRKEETRKAAASARAWLTNLALTPYRYFHLEFDP